MHHQDLEIENIWFTQKNLKRYKQISSIVESVINGDYIDPVLLQEDENGDIAIINGHHRIAAYWKSGRKYLRPCECIIVFGNSLPKFFQTKHFEKIIS